MNRYCYYRVSTDAQDFIQQSNCIEGYLSSNNIDPKKDIKESVVEKVSGTVKSTDRKLAELLAKCQTGDVIYFSELSRLGRNMTDLNNIVNSCCDRGVLLVQAKDGMRIENESIGGKALLFALSLAAEIEVNNIRQRTQMGIDARKKMLRENGVFVSNSGRICTKLGREKGCDTSVAVEASARSQRNAKIAWTHSSPAFAWVCDKVRSNWPRKTIIEEFNKLHQLQPTVFCSRNGSPLSQALLTKWISAM